MLLIVIKHLCEPMDEFIIRHLESLQGLFLLDAIFKGDESRSLQLEDRVPLVGSVDKVLEAGHLSQIGQLARDDELLNELLRLVVRALKDANQPLSAFHQLEQL